MQKKNREKVTKDTVPQGFTLGLALVDAIPVVFFGINCALIGTLFGSPLFIIGALLCLFGGAVKVLWKIIVAVKQKNIWWTFVQMRITMPVGFLLMLISLLVDYRKLSFASVMAGLFGLPSVIFFAAGLLGMILMGIFAVKLDNGNVKSNWVEQLTNGISQICICVGLLLLL